MEDHFILHLLHLKKSNVVFLLLFHLLNARIEIKFPPSFNPNHWLVIAVFQAMQLITQQEHCHPINMYHIVEKPFRRSFVLINLDNDKTDIFYHRQNPINYSKINDVLRDLLNILNRFQSLSFISSNTSELFWPDVNCVFCIIFAFFSISLIYCCISELNHLIKNLSSDLMRSNCPLSFHVAMVFWQRIDKLCTYAVSRNSSFVFDVVLLT